MTLGIIPRSFEDELMPKEAEYPTWRSVIVYCRKRTRNLQHRAYADLVRHPKAPTVKHSVHALKTPQVPEAESAVVNEVAKTDEAPSWVKDLINAVRDVRTAPPPAPHSAARPLKPGAKAVAKPGGKNGAQNRFIFRGCWECGLDDHHRADCPAWKRVLGTNGAPPAGHKGARDIAYGKWKEKNQRKRVNNFEELDEDFLDDEYDPMNFCLIEKRTSWADAVIHEPPVGPSCRINSFAALDDDANHSADDVDVAVDQGGCIATTHETTHTEPVYETHGVIHYAVGNMPGAVPNTSTYALTNATLPYQLQVATLGARDASAHSEAIRLGVNTANGHITSEPVARELNAKFVSPEDALA